MSELRAKIRLLLEEPVADLSRKDRENLAITEAAINLFGGSVIW